MGNHQPGAHEVSRAVIASRRPFDFFGRELPARAGVCGMPGGSSGDQARGAPGGCASGGSAGAAVRHAVCEGRGQACTVTPLEGRSTVAERFCPHAPCLCPCK